jgi:hypothetical protein
MIKIRQLHKWIGIGIGIILLMWSVTGVILMIPGRPPQVRTLPLELEGATVSPQQAIGLASGDSAGAVRSVSLIRVHDRVAYRIDRGRRPVLVDAASGERIEITSALAEAVAREAMNLPTGAVTVAPVTRHDGLYPSGSLPVWRITVAGASSGPSHVSRLDGAFIPAGSRSRFKAVAHDLHNFSILRELVRADWFSRSLAIIAGVVSMASILTGYWLALPRRKPNRRPRSTEPLPIKAASSKP